MFTTHISSPSNAQELIALCSTEKRRNVTSGVDVRQGAGGLTSWGGSDLPCQRAPWDRSGATASTGQVDSKKPPAVTQPLFLCPPYCPIFNYRSIPQFQQHLLAHIFPDSRQGHSEQPQLPVLLACCILYFCFLTLIPSNRVQLGPMFPSALTSRPWLRLGCGDPLLPWQ